MFFHLLAVAIGTIAAGKRADKNNRGIYMRGRLLKYARRGIVEARKATCRTYPPPELCLLSVAYARVHVDVICKQTVILERLLYLLPPGLAPIDHRRVAKTGKSPLTDC